MNKNYQTALLNIGRVGLVAIFVIGASLFPAKPVANRNAKSAALKSAAALDQLKKEGQYESLQTAMKQLRFNVSRTAHSPMGRAGFRAPNPAAGYDAYVSEAGVSIALNDQTCVSLSLQSLGYGAVLQPVGSGEVSGDGNTIQVRRDGGVREWYVNGPDGLEQGFTLKEPPGTRPQGAPLRLALQVSAGWRAVASGDGKLVTLKGTDGQAVEYGKLVVSDSEGRNIPARLTVVDQQVVIEVEDGEAMYPLTIDPLFTLQQRLVATDGAVGDHLGLAVSVDGNTALVGAPFDEVTETDQGSAYVFVRNGATWTQQARLFAPDGASNDRFGFAVSIDGDTALIGSPIDDTGKGSAYVFVRSGTTWTHQQKLTAIGGAPGAIFGAALALDGDTALVGAPQQEAPPPSTDITGSAYVFVRNGTSWTQQARLVANDAQDNDVFGFSVALSADTALIGAPQNAITFSGQGAAYMFTRSGTSWTQLPRLTHGLPAADDNFGNAVALSSKTALIAAYLYGSDDSGKFFTFRYGATGWKQTDGTAARNPTAGAHFGVSLTLDGDMAVVGASLGLPTLGVDQRSAYVYEVSSDPELVRHLGPELGAANDRFGYAVALSGDTVIIGAYLSKVTATAQGAAYAFALHDSRHVEQQRLFASDGAVDDYFGDAVALSGDTVAIGAFGDNIGMNEDQGSVYVFTRSGVGWAFQQKIIANDGAAGDQFGYAVSLSGETLAVGANLDDIGLNSAQGSAYIFTRTETIWTQQQKLTANDGEKDDYFGAAVALEGDTVVIGAPMDTVGNNVSQGSAYVFTRNGMLWGARQRLTASDGVGFDEFGYAVALSGDTVVVGAHYDTIDTNALQGSAYVFVRNGLSWPFQKKLIANDGGGEDYFGSDVAINGDIVAVGAPSHASGGNLRQGAVYVFTRSGTAWTQSPKLIASDGEAGDYFGSAVAVSGDTLVVSAVGDNIGTNTDQGSAYVFTRIGYFFEQQKLTASDGAGADFFGNAVALSGATIVVGASSDNIGTNNNQGSAYVFVTPGCPALTLNPESLPAGRLGIAYNQQFTATATSVGDYQFTVSNGALPPGLTLDLPGLLHGTPTVPGTYRFTITTRFFLSGCPGSRTYTLKITPPCSTITVNPVGLPAALQDRIFNHAFTASGGTEPQTFAVTLGTLPPGLSLSARGVLSGTPTQPGKFSFSITATDANACSGTRAYTLGVGCKTFIVKPDSLPVAKPDAPYTQNLTSTGGAAPYRYTITNGQLPTGVSLSTGGVLSGTPTQTGSFAFTVTVQDDGVCSAVRDYTLVVLDCTYAVTPASRSFAASAATGEVSVTASEGCPWTPTGTPPWLTVTGATTGMGNGQVNYAVAANTGAARQGMVTVAGQTHLVQQAAAEFEVPRLTRLTPNAALMGTDGIMLNVIGTGFTASQRVRWNGNDYETIFESATQLRAVIPAALLSSEGNATVTVVDTATGAQSNPGRFRVFGAVAHASAASYDTTLLAPDSLVAAFGDNLATEVRSAESLPLPTELAGTSVSVRDSQGVTSLAPLLFVAPNQVNYVMPAGLADGVATVTITNGDGLEVASLTEISAVAPGLFSADATGKGAAAALVVRVLANGEQVYEPVARYDAETQTFVLLPIDLSNAAEQVYLVLFGTGIRHRTALETVSIKVGETELTAAYAGPSPPFVGLDQVNVLLPVALSGRGEQSVVLRLSDAATNAVKVRVQ